MKTFIPALLFCTFALGIAPAISCAADMTYVGDSQSASAAGLFSRLKPTLSENGKIRGGAVCGATIEGYSGNGKAGNCHYNGVTSLKVDGGKGRFDPGSGRTSNLARTANKSDTVIIQLGDNHLTDAKVGEKAAALVKPLLTAGKKCVWIGPAAVPGGRCAKNRAAKKKTSEAIKKALDGLSVKGRKCTFVDSYALTEANPPTADKMCLHYADYSKWAKAIQPALKKALSSQGGPPLPPARPSDLPGAVR